MDNPPAGSGSRQIGSYRYGVIMQQIGARGGEGASTGLTNELLEQDPTAVNYQEAMKFYANGQLDNAIKHMEIAIKAKPNSPTLLYNLGVMYIQKGNYPGAIESMRNSIKYIKGTGYTRVNLIIYKEAYMGASVNLGMIYTRVGLYNEAVKVLTEAIQFRPDDVDANYNLGVAYYLMGDMDKAASQMRRCIDLDKNSAEAHNIIGLIYYRKELYAAALDEFQTAAKLNPEEKQYSYNAGIVLAKLGNSDEAGRAFNMASGLKDGEDVRRIYAEQTRANKARELYNEGYTAMENSNPDRAIELFKSALEITPDMVEAHVNLGFSYRMLGDRQNQIRHFEEAVKLKPDAPDFHYNLGLAYSDARMYPEATAEFKRAVELNPSLKEAHFNLGMMLYKTGNSAEAILVFKKCLELSPEWFEAYLNLGTCYLKVNDAKSALAQFEEAAKLKPGSAEAHYNLGIAQMKLEKFDEASRSFQKSLDIDPAYRQARMMLDELKKYQGR